MNLKANQRDKWINKLWCTHMYTNNGILFAFKKDRKVHFICMVSFEMNHTEKGKWHVIPMLGKMHRYKSRLEFAWELG